jgi:hypothetical protein
MSSTPRGWNPIDSSIRHMRFWRALCRRAASRDRSTAVGSITVVISRSLAPETAGHVEDAQEAGHPPTLTIDRAGAGARRLACLAGYPPRPGRDRDEYPPAMFAEGGEGASVRYISPADNRSAGAQIGAQLRGAKEGWKVTIIVGP